MNYQYFDNTQRIPVFPVATIAENEMAEFAVDMQAKGHALFQFSISKNGSDRSCSCGIQPKVSTLATDMFDQFAQAAIKVVFSNDVDRTSFLHPWVWDSRSDTWVNVNALRQEKEVSSFAASDELTLAMFAMNSGAIADILVLHDVPWTLMSGNYESFHSRAIGILTHHKTPVHPDSRQRLSSSERRCLVWCACGKTSSEISEIMSLSENTVNHYFSLASSKLNVVNRTQAVAQAIKTGIIGLDEIC